jgi:hypothetical protein
MLLSLYKYSVQRRPHNLQAIWDALAYKKVANNPHIAAGVPGTWLGFRHKGVYTQYRCAKKHKHGHDVHGPDEGIVACAPFPGRVNRRDVGNSKL